MKTSFRNIIILQKSIILITLVFSFQLLALNLTEEEKAWISVHPVIRIAPDPSFPPIEWFDEENNYKGIAADFMEIIADSLGIKFDVVHCNSWDEVLDKAKSREVDMLPAAAQTPEREEYMNFSNPHLIFPGVIITTQKNHNLKSTKELHVKKAGIVKGYVWYEFLTKDHPDIYIVGVENIIEGLRKVSTDEIDALIATLPIALYYIEKEGIHNLVIAGETEYKTKLSILTRKDWPLLNSIMNKTLKAIPEKTKKEIINKWISLEPIPFYYQEDFWITVLSIFGTGLVILIIVLVWNKSLQKQVEIKTKELEKSLKRERIQADIVRSAPLAIAFGYPDGRLDNCNKAFFDLTGYSEEEMKEINWSTELTPGKWEALESKELEKLTPESNFIKYKKEYIHKNGNIIPIELLVFAKFDINNDISHYVAFISDITERKKAETALKESEEKFRVIFEQSPIAKEIYDANGLLTDVNSKTLELFGIPDKKNVLGFNLWNDPNISELNKETLRKGDPVFYTSVFDFDVVKQNNLYQTTRTGKIYLEIFGMPIIINNTTEGYMIHINEVTDRIIAEQSLEKYKVNLEVLVKERTKELEEKNEKLEKFNKLFMDREYRIKELKDRIKELEDGR